LTVAATNGIRFTNAGHGMFIAADTTVNWF
jgi:hypothetical protein